MGEEVGYSVRFKKLVSQNTIIKYMTDGTLLRELLTDPKMEKYSCIMVDEAHERTVNTDLLCALLKRVLKERTDLKVVISSATLDIDKFKEYFSQVLDLKESLGATRVNDGITSIYKPEISSIYKPEITCIYKPEITYIY